MDRLYSRVHSGTFSFGHFCNIGRIRQLRESGNDKANDKLHYRLGWHWRSRTALAGWVEHGRHSTGRCDMAFDWFYHSYDFIFAASKNGPIGNAATKQSLYKIIYLKNARTIRSPFAVGWSAFPVAP
jgi:hypothetical protein